MVTTRPPKTIVKPTALGPVANTDTKLLIYGLFQKGRVLAQDGIESFWSMLKRAHKGTFHKLSPKHLQRYVDEFAGKHNMRDSGTLAQMRDTVARMVGRNLLYRDLISDNGLSSMRS